MTITIQTVIDDIEKAIADAKLVESSPSPGPSTDLAMTVSKDSDLRMSPDVYNYVQWSSNAQVNADLADATEQIGGGHRPWYSPSTVLPGYQGSGTTFCCTDPEYYVDRGFEMMSCSSQQANGSQATRLLNCWFWLPLHVRHAFCRFVFLIEPDVAAGFTELGMKLSGFSCGSGEIVSPPTNGSGFYWIAWHGPPAGSYGNPPYWEGDYLGDSKVFQNTVYLGGGYQVGVPITVEQELNMGPVGSTPQPNNGRMWINGTQVQTRSVDATGDLQYMALQLYHGGMKPPSKRIHYRIGGCVTAKKYIGVPRELRSGTPLPMQTR